VRDAPASTLDRMTTTSIPLPTVDQVLAMPALVDRKVAADFIDANTHMNIRHYLDAGADSAEELCQRVGINDAYRAERRMGVFTVEHHLRYLAEMREGDVFSVHTRVLERSDKVGHLLAFIVDRTGGRLACTMEIVLVHVGMDTRRPTPFPDDVATAWDALIAESDSVGWPAPVCGAMGVRR
jgi:acyl-CoA thioester hydrolase